MTATITDFSQFASLRAGADRHDPQALREVAAQFEALFVQSLMKNMRGAELAEPMFGSEQMDMYQGMFDQQLSLEMASGRGLGLAEMLVRQLGGTQAPAAAAGGQRAATPAWSDPAAFVRDLWPHAERVGNELGVAPRALVAQAALETGWGAQVMRGRAGQTSNNLFGVKAGGGWQGDRVARPTLEYENGIAQRRVEQFRAYPDIAAAFDDYAALLSGSDRYLAARSAGLDVSGFAAALQDAGYATDPQYAQKIERVLQGETMQRALDGLKNSSSRPIETATASVDGD